MPTAFLPPLLAGTAAFLTAAAMRGDLGIRLSAGLPILAVAIAALAALLALITGAWATSIVLSALFVTCGLTAEIDRRHCLIPDPLVFAIALLALAAPFGDAWTTQGLGALLLGGLFYGVRRAFAAANAPDALGLGDVKLAAAMGAFLGPYFGLIAVAVAGLATMSVLVVSRATSPPAKLTGAGAPFGIGLAAALAATAAARVWITG
ncbi:MAG: prepilin peptidase [Terricaulis sp.]